MRVASGELSPKSSPSDSPAKTSIYGSFVACATATFHEIAKLILDCHTWRVPYSGPFPSRTILSNFTSTVLMLFNDAANADNFTYHQHCNAPTDKRPYHANASVKHLPARSPKSKIVKMQKSHRLSVKHNSRDNYAI